MNNSVDIRPWKQPFEVNKKDEHEGTGRDAFYNTGLDEVRLSKMAIIIVVLLRCQCITRKEFEILAGNQTREHTY